MLSSSQFAIKQISDAALFSNVGVRDAEEVAVSSWWEAMQHATSNDLLLIRALPFVTRLNSVLESDLSRIDACSRFHDEIKAIVASIVARQCGRAEIESEHREPLVRIVAEDMSRYAFEIHTQDIQPLGFYSDLFRWYTLGHFPCGWEGDFPSGKHIVY